MTLLEKKNCIKNSIDSIDDELVLDELGFIVDDLFESTYNKSVLNDLETSLTSTEAREEVINYIRTLPWEK
jgi:hypothetical protein